VKSGRAAEWGTAALHAFCTDSCTANVVWLDMLDRSSIMVVMNVLDTTTRARVVSALVEGCSIRATCRMTGAAKGTVLKLLADLGAACREYHDANVRGLRCKRLQCDEIWSFCGAKDKNVLPDEQGFGRGSVWTWTALDADTKLIAGYHVGTRDAGCAYEFMQDLAPRLVGRVQLTTDGHKAYINAVADAFGPANIDFAMLVKLFGETPAGDGRWACGPCVGACGPDRAHAQAGRAAVGEREAGGCELTGSLPWTGPGPIKDHALDAHE
jgi:IS1 family transposase